MWTVLHWEFCKRFEFDYSNKWSEYKPNSVFISWQIKTFGLIYSNQKTDYVVVIDKGKNSYILNVTILSDHKDETNERIYKYQNIPEWSWNCNK